MKKLRWVMEGEFWEVDMSTPNTLQGTALAVPAAGVSRGIRLSRPKQIDFMQRFMAAPFVPSYSPHHHGFSLQRVLTIPFPFTTNHNWFATLLGQFNVQKLMSVVKESGVLQEPKSSWFQSFKKQLSDTSLYALGFCSEISLTSDDNNILLFSSEGYGGHHHTSRNKAVLHHKLPHHNLTVEAVSPGLFADKAGKYWDVPLWAAIGLASLAPDSGAAYHLSMHHIGGMPKLFSEDDHPCEVPPTLLPGLSLKAAFAYKHNVDFWRSEGRQLKFIQPYDIFLSNPHISASGIVGATVTASHGDNSIGLQVEHDSQGFRGFRLHAPAVKCALLADIFASLTFTAQHGNYQRLFLDLTRFHARLDFPSGSNFLSGATRLAQDLINSQQPCLGALLAICPKASISLQQQIAGPFSFRVDSRVVIDLKNRDWHVSMDEPVFAMEYALQVLGSAKAVAWYSPKHQEFMVELRFFER
ncbi:hypothetical protein CFOL_v3_28773 [Cephalotus follicularis]|uniref:Uncharacterized protein n=1 Tax=Cephalotus follicularis TaxID=3775 RepID=A0A1Q3CYV3_CEPFO|nr:hypothetical protein CFOL_v3_28773 [Cephalotus follicularis]